jgi:hypothetical protein
MLAFLREVMGVIYCKVCALVIDSVSLDFYDATLKSGVVLLAEPKILFVMACSLMSLSLEAFHRTILFFPECKWKPLYALNGHELCFIFFFTRVLMLTPLIFVVMDDYYLFEPYCQLSIVFQGLSTSWVLGRDTVSLCFEDSSWSFPLCNKVLEASVCA